MMMVDDTSLKVLDDGDEPDDDELLVTMHMSLVISGFSLYQAKKTKKYKELGPAKVHSYRMVL